MSRCRNEVIIRVLWNVTFIFMSESLLRKRSSWTIFLFLFKTFIDAAMAHVAILFLVDFWSPTYHFHWFSEALLDQYSCEFLVIWVTFSLFGWFFFVQCLRASLCLEKCMLHAQCLIKIQFFQLSFLRCWCWRKFFRYACKLFVKVALRFWKYIFTLWRTLSRSVTHLCLVLTNNVCLMSIFSSIYTAW